MKIHHVLLFCVFSASCGFVNARLSIFTGAEGGNGSVYCHFSSGSSSGSWKFFCKEECSEGGILVKAESDTANNGRYSFKYESRSFGKKVLSVSITNLTQSDSGKYKYGVGTSSGPDSYCEIEARVSDELMDKNAGFIWTNTEGENATYPCFYDVDRSRFFLCKDDCQKEENVLIETDQKKAQSGRYGVEYIDGSIFGLYVTITHMKTTDTGRYVCGYGRALSPDSSNTISIVVIVDPSTQTLRPLAPSPSTPTATPQSLIGSTSGSSAPSPVSTDITEQSTAAVVTTSKPTQTLQPFSASAAQGLTSSTAPSVFSDTTDQFTGYILPLVGCVSLGVLLLVLLLVYKWKTVKNSRSFELSNIHENQALAQSPEDSL